MLVCGIDEAGRGPLIGPLVIAGVSLDEKTKSKLQQLGVVDSKLLSPSRRSLLSNEIKTLANKFSIITVSALEIDNAVTSSSTNLNFLEAEKSAEILNNLKPQKAILDCPSINIPAYTEFIQSLLHDKTMSLVVEHKADLHHTEAAAASILAKVTRDDAIDALKKSIGIDFGSGYPADPRTAKFVREYASKKPEVFRKSWKTYKNAIQQNKQSKLF